MAKKEKRKWSSKNKQKGNNNVIPFKSKSPKKSLKKKLQEIYYEDVNLDTTCSGRCECCKVAMPQMNYSEFCQVIHEVWDKEDRGSKIELICKCVEYFFRNEYEKWEKDSLVKPCLLLDEDNKCKYYENRPLSCRMYGLWPKVVYERRVDRFANAYKGILKRKELPLCEQCPNVELVNKEQEITEEVIEVLYKKLDELDKKTGSFTDVQIQGKENYRTFHDWLLLKIFGEDWLVSLTTFMLAADKKMMEEQITLLQNAIRQKFVKDVPRIDVEI